MEPTPSQSEIVFISYCSHDQIVANTICSYLEQRGVRCWIAPRDLRAGEVYAEALIEGINQSRILVVILSSETSRSPHVLREVERATSKGLRIIAVRVENVRPAPAMEYYISSVQWLDAFAGPLDAHLIKLYDSIRPQERSQIKSSNDGETTAKHSVSSAEPRRAFWLVNGSLIVGSGAVGLCVAVLVPRTIFVPILSAATILLEFGITLRDRVRQRKEQAEKRPSKVAPLWSCSAGLLIGWLLHIVWLSPFVQTISIKHSGKYLWSEATEVTRQAALDKARFGLLQNLLHVAGETTDSTIVNPLLTELAVGPVDALDPLTGLRQQKTIESKTGESFRVLAALRRDVRADLARQQKNLVQRWTQEGREAESDGRISDALGGYFWAYLMARTLVDTMRNPLDLSNGGDPCTALHAHMQSVFNGLTATAEEYKREGDWATLSLRFLYNGHDVRSIRFRTVTSGDSTTGQHTVNGDNTVIQQWMPRDRNATSLALHMDYDRGAGLPSAFLRRVAAALGANIYKNEPLIFVQLPRTATAHTPGLPAENLAAATNRHVQVLAGISSATEFLTALRAFERNGRLTVAGDPSGFRSSDMPVFAVILGSQEVRAVLRRDGALFKNVRTGEIYSTLTEASKGNRVLWIGPGVQQ